MEVEALTVETVRAVHEMVGREISDAHAAALAGSGGYALVDDDGPFAIGGIYPLRPQVGMAWTLMTRRWRRYARQVTALCLFQIERAPYTRLEAATVAGWGRGARWLYRMGFSLETACAPRWDGVNDYALYTRLSE